MGRNREYHTHFERLTRTGVAVYNRLQVIGFNWVNRLAILLRNVLFHFCPDIIRNSNTVTVQVHTECCDNVRLRTKTNCCTQWLTCQHVRAVQLTVDDTVEQHFPVRLRFQCYIQAFVFEIAFFISNSQRCHIGQFDKTEFQLFFFRPANVFRICDTRH